MRMRVAAALGLALIASFAALLTSTAQDEVTALDPCSLLTKAEVEQTLGIEVFMDPESAPFGAANICDFDGGQAQVMLFIGADSQSKWDQMIASFGEDKAQRSPVGDFGEGAYAFYTKPRNQYQDAAAFIVVPRADKTVVVSAAAPKGKAGEDAHAHAIALAKIVLGRLS
jgi:hypothetical protein